jgi:Reverse transcriptase (RNA-dependent DNA polymerase)
LEQEPGVNPKSCRPYGVPKLHQPVFKEELDCLEKIGVLSCCGASEWLAPTFIVPEKDGRVRWVSDFQELNKLIKRKVYNLPRIQDILSKRTGYKYFSKIDISMQYYTFVVLDESSKELCTICTAFGNYRYNRLPMGVKQSPDIAQEIMEDLFCAIEQVDVYIDDVGCFDNPWDSHLETLHKVLTILEDSNFTVNPFKCEWAVQETNWLSYWLPPKGLKPWRKKVNAILALQPPQTATQLRSFLGAVNFYHDMYPCRSHILAPLTAQSGQKTKINWTP